jgi:hypothetical protein
MTVRTFLLALCVLLGSELPAVSKGGSVGNKHDPWNSHHIDNLPPEIRDCIAGICKGPPAALHDFATYSPVGEDLNVADLATGRPQLPVLCQLFGAAYYLSLVPL